MDDVGARLRAVRLERGLTLAQLAQETDISVSTLSRLESGGRRPTLELLLALSRVHRVSLDDLVGAPPVGDPRVHLRPEDLNGMTIVRLTRESGGLLAFKMVIPGGRSTPEPKTHEGYEWLYVLSGRLRLTLGEHDLVLKAGEVAEFDTRVPHWFGSADKEPVELLSLFGSQGERIHVRAQPRKKSTL